MWRLALPLALCAALTVASFIAGWRVHGWRDAAASLSAARSVVTTVGRQAAISQSAAVAAQSRQDRIRVVTHTLIERIPAHVTPSADAAFPLSVGWVRLHDAAALGVDLPATPAGSGEPDDATSPVAASAAAEVVVRNYGHCHADQARLAALQTWARDQGLAP